MIKPIHRDARRNNIYWGFKYQVSYSFKIEARQRSLFGLDEPLREYIIMFFQRELL